MNPKEYVENILKTESVDFDEIRSRMFHVWNIRLDHASDGLCTEAGEFKDALKKFKFYGRDIDRTNLIEELGDILWYVGIACDVMNVSLEEVMEKNIAKLKARYGEKFSEECAENRDLENEKKVLRQVQEEIIHAFHSWNGESATTICGLEVEVTSTTSPTGPNKNLINCHGCLRIL